MTPILPINIPSARPAPFSLPAARTALVIIDMQRDFVLEQGYGAVQCPSAEVFAQVAGLISPCLAALRAARKLGMTVVHTREGHPPDLSDCPPTKTDRQVGANTRHVLTIGDEGPMGRLLVQGAYGHDIVDELTPRKDEVLLDKPGKGSFYNTDLHEILVARGITHLLFCGVTAECCVASTFREANDHGFECCVLTDCTGGFNAAIVSATMDMFCAYDGLLGYASTSTELVKVAAAQPAHVLAKTEPASSTAVALESLHTAYVAAATLVVDVISTALTRMPKDAILASTIALAAAAALDADTKVDVDGNRDLSLLHGIPFATTPELPVTAAIVMQMSSLGGVHLGTVPASSAVAAVAAGAVTFVLSTSSVLPTDVPIPASVALYMPSKGSLATAGAALASPSATTLAVLSSSVLDARTLWSVLVRLPDPQAQSQPWFMHYRERPIVSVDYRGFEGGGIRYAVMDENTDNVFAEKIETLFSADKGLLTGRRVSGKVAAAALHEAASLALAPSAAIALEKAFSASPAAARAQATTLSPLDTVVNIQELAATSASFNKSFNIGIDSPDVVVAPFEKGLLAALEALHAPAVVLDGIVFIVARGLDARVLDAAVLAQP
ncbi:Isochorismatase-like protein [Limtongia smithiae]|uniref:Isochorismatase-like protein n=1 Tax=Limtongia smithiae TaxID=1125753 RepID=UPI0034CE95C6